MNPPPSLSDAPRSILDYVAVGAPFPLTSAVTIKGEPCLALAIDNGNDAAKAAVLDGDGRLHTIRVPTAHVGARQFQGGSGETTYQLGDGTSYWIGAAALRNEGRALPVGPTAQRLVDPRQQQFLAAVLVEVLTTAGYTPGNYTLALGVGIPNTEIVKESPDSDKLVVAPETRAALKELRGATWRVSRTDIRGQIGEWTLTLCHIMPQAQSLGSFICWSKSPVGKVVVDYDAVTVLDLGGGDTHRTDISIAPYRMTTQRLGDGTIDIARSLKTLVPKAELNDVTAQFALVSRQALIAGRLRDISGEVAQAIGMNGQDLIGIVLPALQQTRRFVILTGGGTILLNGALTQRLTAAGKVANQDYLLIPEAFAAVLNVIGALFAVLFAAGTKR